MASSAGLPTYVRSVAQLAAALAVWQSAVSLGFISPVLLPSPSLILGAAVRNWDTFAEAFLFTLTEIFAAVTLAWASGIFAGVALGTVPIVAKATAPILSSLFAVPIIIWYPFFVVFFGIGPESKVAYAATAGFFPIALYTLNAVQNVDHRYMVLARSLGGSWRQTVTKFLFPLILPQAVSGLRIGTSMTVVGVIVSEMLASVAGLGFWISYHRTLFNTGEVYLGILLALSFALAVNAGLTRLENNLSRWRDSA